MKRLNKGILFLLSVLLLLPSFARAEQAPAPDGTLPCTFAAPEEAQSYTDHLSDGDPYTTVTLYSKESLVMQLPDQAPTRLFFDFYERPEAFTLTYLDRDGAVLGTEQIEDPGFLTLLPLPYDTAASVTLTADCKEVRIAEWLACTDAFMPPFPDAGSHADVLLVLNEPGDELSLFGGLLAELCREKGLSVQVVYFTEADGYRTHQCIEVLRAAGVTRMPLFGTGCKPSTNTDKAVYSAIGESAALQKTLVDLIRTLQPSLILTPDATESQPQYANSVIARETVKAAAAAADASHQTDAAPYSVPKVYSLSQDGETTVSLNEPLTAFGGRTAAELGKQLSAYYREERVFGRTLPDTLALAPSEQTNASGGFWAQLPVRTPEPTLAPTSEPTLAPTPEPTATPARTEAPTQTSVEAEAPTAASTAEPEPTAQPTEAGQTERGMRLSWLFAVAGTVLGVAAWFLLRKLSKPKRIIFAALPLLLGALLAFLLRPQRIETAPQAEATPATTAAPTGQPTPEPTEAPGAELIATSAPTEAPTPEPTEEPTPAPTAMPTPDPNDAFFLDGDGEEFELDFENGHWWYKNRVLAIDVVRVETTYEGRGPLVYYVADIRMREYSSFRASHYGQYRAPYKIARIDSAVLAVTGDCVFNEADQKGCLIRNGIYYGDQKRASVLIIEDDAMSMRAARPYDVSGRVLLDAGVRDVFSFGPTLVENGAISEDVLRTRVKHVNPRAGIGMIEPGHWIAIASDGRQPGYSMSISLDYFAQLFVDLGCTVAYNMDGGSSAGMIFMGETLTKHKGSGTDDVQRSWLDAIEFGYSEQVPDPDAPTKNDGYHH